MSEGKKEILLGDCLELMKDIPNGSIDMILCDLPYGTTACKWDVIIPFDKLWEQYKRIIKDNGAIVLTASQPFTTDLINSQRDLFKYELIWNKENGRQPYLAKIQPIKSHENIIVFSKGKISYHPIMRLAKKENMRERIKNNFKGVESGVWGKMKEYTPTKDEARRYPLSVLNFNMQNAECNQKFRIHPTQKPVALFEYLIKTYTNEGDLVLDNCAGSGTTAIACLNTNRQFIVMEKEQKYYDIILKRVADFNKNFEPQTLFGNKM
jgi:site-specific DNA-methyltransferase (adenine-specific)